MNPSIDSENSERIYDLLRSVYVHDKHASDETQKAITEIHNAKINFWKEFRLCIAATPSEEMCRAMAAGFHANGKAIFP